MKYIKATGVSIVPIGKGTSYDGIKGPAVIKTTYKRVRNIMKPCPTCGRTGHYHLTPGADYCIALPKALKANKKK